jgi:hypothetical protein
VKLLGIVTFALILSGLSGARCGATVYHSNGSPANIQLIHDTQAMDGDAITIPAGTFSWTTGVRISKGITLIGQTTTDPVNKTASDQTIVLDNVTRGSGGRPIIDVESVAGRSYRVSGITFRPGSVAAVNNNGSIKLAGTSQAVRFDHCHFATMPYQAVDIAVSNAIYGVIDHNVFDFSRGTSESITVHMSNWGGLENGDGSWIEPPYYGSGKFIFIEDNCFNNTSGSESAGVLDDLLGARWVLRYNHLYDVELQSHGTESGRYRGGRARECYKNDFHFTVARNAGGIRSGSIITHDNTWYGARPTGGFTLQNYRDFFAWLGTPWKGASGDNPWDANDPHGLYDSGTCSAGSDRNHIVDVTKTWTINRWSGFTAKRLSDSQIGYIDSNTSNTLNVYWYSDSGGGAVWTAGDQYEIHKVLIALDQPGRGAGGFINVNHPAWPRQTSEPCYSWNDRHVPTNTSVNLHVGIGSSILIGRDFYNNRPMPGYTPYTYPHPLVTAQPTPPPTPPPSTTQCSQLQQRLDRLQRRQQRLQRGHRQNPRLNRRIRRLQQQLQVQHCL